ncbi:hypothetical protein I0Q12_26045 [Rhodococcus sp. CX]|uniref:hypothetical protein n=1 Tax=Rhodococcus sp. CX TaxID=2789880 RepID=UPI0018CE8057|nr:hypothetical protein [Rhodococcus sp. CX]MBH0122767.1 hypothetical protein [Rhodococcus sp. CX]
MTVPLSGMTDDVLESRWCSPLVEHHFDTAIEVRVEEAAAIGELGVRNLRRLQHHDPTAPRWRGIERLLQPLEAVNADLDSPATAHRRRAMADVVAVLLVCCAEKERTFWGWSTQEWIDLLGRDQSEFRRRAPAWVGDEVRPYLAAHAYLLGSFTEFHRLGSFQRLTLSWRIFGRDRVNGEVARRRKALAE